MTEPIIPNQNQPEPAFPDPLSTKPAFVAAMGAPLPPAQIQTMAVAPSETPMNWTSVIFGILLLLTFFTPLGAVLFLPMVITGILVAIKSISARRDNTMTTNGGEVPEPNLAMSVLKGIITFFAFGVLGIVGLIAIFFIAVASGSVHLRMGS